MERKECIRPNKLVLLETMQRNSEITSVEQPEFESDSLICFVSFGKFLRLVKCQVLHL